MRQLPPRRRVWADGLIRRGRVARRGHGHFNAAVSPGNLLSGRTARALAAHPIYNRA